MKIATFHWYLSAFILLFALNQQKGWSLSAKPKWVLKTQQYFIAKGSGSDSSRFLGTLFTGDKTRLRKEMKRKFKLLGIYHLFTPSGLHLSSLFLPLFFLLKKRPSKFLRLLISGMLLIPFAFEKFYSLKRMCLFHLIKILFPKMNNRTVFILVFILDLIRGGYNDSPLSYGLSFLFLGSILLSTHLWSLMMTLFFSQMLVASLFGDFFSPLGFLAGQFLTMIFSTLFPFLVLSSLTFSGIDLMMTNIFIDVIDQICLVLKSTPTFLFSPLFPLTLYGILIFKKRITPSILVLLILPSQLF
ncbi:MAG: hypothetical protein EP319_14095 [Deltaproteobacteria bacterium]|nr:MAG: hypothetical protein EP319_14095 [Deltaproteobacteria bacterium]